MLFHPARLLHIICVVVTRAPETHVTLEQLGQVSVTRSPKMKNRSSTRYLVASAGSEKKDDTSMDMIETRRAMEFTLVTGAV